LVGAVALAAGACGGGTDGTDAATADRAAASQSQAPGVEPVASRGYPREAATPAELQDLRAEGHDGFDRITIELGGTAAPSYRVAPVPGPVEMEDSDGPAPIEGETFLEIRFAGASAQTRSGTRSFQGPDRVPVPDGGVVTEVVRTGGTGGPLVFAVGLRAEAPFTVAVERDPTRLVVDVETGA
jgi:hypothetical protein